MEGPPPGDAALPNPHRAAAQTPGGLLALTLLCASEFATGSSHGAGEPVALLLANDMFKVESLFPSASVGAWSRGIDLGHGKAHPAPRPWPVGVCGCGGDVLCHSLGH